MIENNKKMKKRRVGDAADDAPTENKKSKNSDTNSTKVPMEVLEKPIELSQEQAKSKGKKKEKKKKRKLSVSSENAVAEKKPKTNGNAAALHEPIQNGETNNKDTANDTENDDGDAKPKVSNKEASQLTGKSLRKSFNSPEGMNVLKKFLVVCKENKERDLASEYLKAGGSVLEILRLLDTSDKKNLTNACTIFSAMHLIIMKILAEYPQYLSTAEEACRHFINSHLSFVHSMLSSQSCMKHRKVVLRLLASMVALGGSLPRELLGHLSFHTQVLETLSQQTKPDDAQSVRTCFIHFILAFLVEGNTPIIRAMLDKRGMLSCIFPELVYDSHTTVHLVLDTVKTYVLENQFVSKTSKLHVFSTPVLQNLVGLYNWKGPKNWPGPNRKKRDGSKDVVHPEEKEIAVEAVHDFLTTLLTSNRYGIIFHDRSLGTSSSKKNQLVNTVLQSLDRPWEHPKPLELVVKILVACPDLIRPQLTYTEPFLEPRASKKWVLAMRFVGKIIESLDPDNCLKPCLSELSASQLISAVTTLTAPLAVLKIAIVPSLNSFEIVIRHEAVLLLTIMLKQVKAFTAVVENNCHGGADFQAFSNSMTDYISKNVPSLESILKVWSLALAPDSSTTEETELIPGKQNHFAAILDLLQAYRDACPERLDIGASTDGDIHPSILLTGLKELPDVELNEFSGMKVKALQFLLAVDPAAFAPNQPLFGESLSFLIALLDQQPSEIVTHSRRTMKMLLTASRMFEGCTEQMDIWLNSFTTLSMPDERIEVANWFVKVMQHAIKRVDKYLNLIDDAEQIAGEQVMTAERMEDLFNDLYETDYNVADSSVVNMLPWTSISPLLCSALEDVKKNPNELILRHLSHITILTLHCQVVPGTLIHLAKSVEGLPAKKYLMSWLAHETPKSIKKGFPVDNIVSKFSKALLSTEAIEIDTIFQGNRKVEFNYEEKKISLSHELCEYEVAVLLRMTLFYLTQFMPRDELTKEKFEKYKTSIITLLNIAKDVGGVEDSTFIGECSQTIFFNPAVLQFFSPFCKAKSMVEKIVTTGLLDICRVAIDLNDETMVKKLFLPYKNKLMMQLRSVIRKCKDGGKMKNSLSLIEFIEVLRPGIEDVVEVLGSVMELPKESFLADDKNSLAIWGVVVPKLIALLADKEKYPTESKMLDPNFVKKVVSYLTQLKINHKLVLDEWETSLQKYLECYPHNIAGVTGRAFNTLLEHARSSATINLLAFLVSRNDTYIPLFVKYVTAHPKALKRSDLILKIIESNLSHTWDKEFLNKIHGHYKSDVIYYFVAPTKDTNWIPRHVDAAVYLIDSCFDSESCTKACETVSSNVEKMDNVDLNYAKLLVTLYKKSASFSKDPEDLLKQLVQFLVRITLSALKKDAKNEEKLESLSQSLCETIKLLKSQNAEFVFEELTKNYSWAQFTRFTLKLGLKTSKDDKKHVPLLKTLVSVCDVAYRDASEDEYVKTLFEMTTSHSEFVNLMLSSQSVKKDLLQLLWVLVRKNHSVMSTSQIPLYLAAYNATLSESDQWILLILQHYEANKMKLNLFRPYLWGEAAATHYSVKGEADTALWRQPTTSQVLDLFNLDTINETITNFPIHRGLKPTSICAAENVYDPSYYLPLLNYLLSENNVVACHKVTQSGALAIVFAACGSSCSETRSAAYTVIARYYFHLDATNSKEKLLWIRIIDALRNGILKLETPLKDVRLSCLVSTFLARASLITTQPMNVLYSSIQGFFMAKPALELKTIPELLNFFHSAEVQYQAHRHWILEVLRDGMKTELDTELAFHCRVFKIIMVCYNSSLSDPITNRLILQVLEATVKIPKAGLLLANKYGLVVWLYTIAMDLHPGDLISVNLIVSITRELLSAILQTNERDTHLQFLLLTVLKALKPNLSINTSVSCFAAYTKALNEIMQTKAYCSVFKLADIRDLAELGKKILNNDEDFAQYLEHSIKYVAKDVTRNSTITTPAVIRAQENLRKLIFTWCAHIASDLNGK